jgi:hypothetical protein
LQACLGDFQVHQDRFPARLAAEDFGRKRVANAQKGDEIKRLVNQTEHTPVVGVVGDRELPLQRP